MKTRFERVRRWCLAVVLVSGCSSPSGTDASDSAVDATTDIAVTDGNGAMDTTPPIDVQMPVDAGSDGARDGATLDGSGPSSCVGLRYCETFESFGGAIANGATVGPWMASVGTTGETMRVDSMHPYSGNEALHVTMPAGAAAHGTLSRSVPAGIVPGNHLFGRVMIYYTDTGGNGLAIGVHSWFFNASGVSNAADGGVSMNLGGGGARFQLNYHPPAPLTEQSVLGGTQSAGAWHCVQWEYDGSGSPAANHARVWVDGAMAIEVLGSHGWNFATPWNAFVFGFNHYQTLTNPVDVFIDDFAVNETMVPCPP